MASAKQIRRRIRAVRNIRQITQAMKMVASARLQKAQRRVEAARPYAEKIRDIISGLSASGAALSHPLLETREENRVAVIIIGADRGLAGSYHSNIVRMAARFLEQRPPDQAALTVIGKKALTAFKKAPQNIQASMELPGTDVDFAMIRPLSQDVQQMFSSGDVDAVYMLFTEFYSAIAQRAVTQRLLPVEPLGTDETPTTAGEYIFEPEPERLLGQLLSRYVDTQLYRAVLESIASEQGARMTAMSSATTNAGEMIDRLTLSLNRARQAAITTEIAEIVGTAEALK